MIITKTLWAGWVVLSPQNLFFARDTGYSKDFAEIGRRYSHIDLSLIPIGANSPRWFISDMFNIRTEYRQHFFQKFGGGVSIPVELSLGLGVTI